MEPTTAELMQHISDLHDNEEIFFKVCKPIVLTSFGDYILTLHGWNRKNKDQFISANYDKLAATYNITKAHTIAFFRERNIAAHQCTARTVANFLMKSSNKAGRAVFEKKFGTGFPFKLPAEQPVPPSPLLPLLPSFPSASESTQTSRASEKKRIAEHEEDEEIIGVEKQKGTKFLGFF
ncbi:hypothetical protein TWF106_006166 [Orbilia oligospora]|uniref:Uncharacterized protein n=1 Tax=Orbilia oligospora TaxID=2813651 RepID=A0A7C8Q584_ORBOL|nr:hypothetical protein TWF106_006166 [Orbilia oligospora]